MKEYLIEQGADCRLATDPVTGFGKQAKDIFLVIETNTSIAERGGKYVTNNLSHLKLLYELMMEIPDEDLPKKIEVPD